MNKTKVFGLGLPRTGTTSLHHILRALDYDCKHFVDELFAPPDWSILEKHDAFVDSPVPMLFKECDERIPNSKFILTTRSLNTWLASMEWLFTHGKVLWNWSPMMYEYHHRFMGTDTFDRGKLTSFWHTYHADVNDYFAGRTSDLLCIDIDDGFDSSTICEFLEIPLKDISMEKKNARRYTTRGQRFKYFLRRMITSTPYR